MFNLGSWAEKDVNPALFSCELMTNASSLVEDEEVLFLVYLLIIYHDLVQTGKKKLVESRINVSSCSWLFFDLYNLLIVFLYCFSSLLVV